MREQERSALVLVGFQRDYFDPEGALFDCLEGPDAVADVLANTLDLVAQLAPMPTPIATAPIVFTPDYREIVDPIGILGAIQERGALRAGTPGAETVTELRAFEDRIVEIPGRRGLNAFSSTELDAWLRSEGVNEVVLAGLVTSICIDSTARSAFERGYRVCVLSDCTRGRSALEQSFYCEQIFPLYATVSSRATLVARLSQQWPAHA